MSGKPEVIIFCNRLVDISTHMRRGMMHWEDMTREFKVGRMSGVNVERVADVSS